jgi:cyclin T
LRAHTRCGALKTPRSPQLTIATATVFCHRFYALNSHTRTENDWHVLAPACLFLAGKVEETPKALRDVVFVAYMMRHRKEPEKAQEALKNKARGAQRGGRPT